MAITKTPERLRSRWLRPALALGSLFTGLLLAEGGARLWMRLDGKTYDRASMLESIDPGVDRLETFSPKPGENGILARRILHPFFGAANGEDTGGVLKHLSETPPDSEFEILIVGGSVAMLLAKDAGESLEEALTADPRLGDRRVRVLNGAHVAYKQPQQLNMISLLLAHGHRPDVVINLDGLNEVAVGMRNGLGATHPLYPATPVWAAVLAGRGKTGGEAAVIRFQVRELDQLIDQDLAEATRSPWSHSALIGMLRVNQFSQLHQQRAELSTRFLALTAAESKLEKKREKLERRGGHYVRDEAAISELTVRSWIECSISLQAICAARGIPYVHVLQPTLWDDGAKPMVGEEAEHTVQQDWLVGIRRGYPQMRAAAPELKAAGVHFLDLSMVFADVHEPLYFDACHFEPTGAKMLVQEIARAVLEVTGE